MYRQLPRWDLSRIYTDYRSPERENDISELRRLAEDFQKTYRGRVADLSADELKTAFDVQGKIHLLSAKLGLHAYLSFAQDTIKDENQALVASMDELNSEISTLIVFFDLELAKSDMSGWENSDILSEYRYYIKKLIDQSHYDLTEELEAFSIEKNLTGKNAFAGLFDEFFGSFAFEMETPQGHRRFSEEEALAVLHLPDREYRTSVYSRFLEVVGENKVVLSNIYNNIMLDHRLNVKRRKYENLMTPRNVMNEVSDAAVNSMLESVESGYDIAREYFSLKAKMLGMKDFTNADIYAPIFSEKREIPYEEARRLTTEAYGNFDERLRPVVNAFFEDGRVDAALAEGKRSGAFCYGADPRMDSYILLNYTGDIRSVQTLAHELGHGIHHQLSKKQNFTSFDTPLTMAETASVFGEILLNELMIRESSDPKEKLAIMASQMEGIIATVFRQTVLTRFEERTHKLRDERRVSADEICNIWWEENKKLYGDAVGMVDSYRWGWAYIPHFIHTPFYCYAYSFGQLLVIALYNDYQKRSNEFIEGYRELLSSGGSDRPSRLLQKNIGLDIENAGFWNGAIELLRHNLQKMKELMAEL